MPFNWDLSFRVRVRSECVPSIFCSDESKVLILCFDATDMSTYIRVGAYLSSHKHHSFNVQRKYCFKGKCKFFPIEVGNQLSHADNHSEETRVYR
jgi:hypothetical protein